MSAVVIAPPSAQRAARSRAATRDLWRDRLARFPSSGLTVAQFCAIEACSVPSFYCWKRRLAAEALDKPAPHQHNADGGARLLPVRLQPAGPPAELVLPSGAVLRLPSGTDLDWVRSLVAALGDAAC
jgi:hypothetical protein